MTQRGISGFVAIFALASTVAGCSLGQSQPLSFFTLTPSITQATPAVPTGSPMVALQTVRLPEYLNQKPIVTRTRGNELAVAADANWAGALDDNITKVLVENLSRLLGSTRVVSFPVSAALPVQQVVQVDVTRFEAATGGQVELAAQWLVFGDGGRRFETTNSAVYTTTALAPGGFDAVAAAMSRLLGDLAQDIAVSLAVPPRPLGPTS